eukprot:CAMPEP_0184295166 /NCGR_PEP_ID=MMETSP1049-20130417/6111_1 /TAXON_ID=77928 /ORGANISM="Proteomonas sulcata, Strain CCMP704" /LENGTH=344 /DNA_ID=CAMNT_0026603617 /DNA_START=422 /DNA_END=1456 /DNA_ORIENTATION=-
MVVIRCKGLIPLVLAQDLRHLEGTKGLEREDSGDALLGPKHQDPEPRTVFMKSMNDELSRMVPPEPHRRSPDIGRDLLADIDEKGTAAAQRRAEGLSTLPRRGSDPSNPRSEASHLVTPELSDDVANSDLRSLESFDDLGAEEKKFDFQTDGSLVDNSETDLDLVSVQEHNDFQGGETDSASLVDLDPVVDDQMTASQLRERYATQNDLFLGGHGSTSPLSGAASASGVPAYSVASVEGELETSASATALSALQETVTNSLQLLAVPDPQQSPDSSPRSEGEISPRRSASAGARVAAQPQPEVSSGWRGGLAIFKQSLAILKEDYEDEMAEIKDRKKQTPGFLK